MAFQSDQILLNYRLIEKLGEGGMGVVWKAEDQRLGREVAIKVLPDAFARDPKRLARFEHEAKLLASLNNPNIATIHGLELFGDVPLLVMELVPGETVAERISRHGPWTYEGALPLCQQLSAALAAAHDSGIIHRDLKPANVTVTPDGRVKVLDFGLAKALEEAVPDLSSDDAPTVTRTPTRSGMVVGTANYMSPEQLRGMPLDRRSDLFQLGIVFCEMVSGRHPFSGQTSVDVQHAILRSSPQLEPMSGEVPAGFLQVVGKLLEKESDYRYPDAHSVEVDLRTLRRDSSEIEVSSWSPAARRRSGRRWLWSAAAVAGLALGAWLLWGNRPDTSKPSAAVPARLVPLTEAGGSNFDPSFSPDGKSVVFGSNRGGAWDLWITLVSGGDPVPITTTPETESDPVWSPDGTRMAFTRQRLNENKTDVFVMPALGGVARRIAEEAYEPAWSPDGQWLAYVELMGGWSRIARIKVGEPDSPIPVSTIEEGRFHRNPTWSPDGEWIVFTRSQGGDSGQLVQVLSQGGSPIVLTADPPGVFSRDPVFTPDGRYVIHASDRGGTTNLWRVPFLGGEPERVTSGAGPDGDVDVSNDGKRLVYSNTQFEGLVVSIAAPSANQTVLTSIVGGTTWGVSVSRDGSRIAFSRKLAGRPWTLMHAARDGTDVKPVADVGMDMIWPRFTRGGESLVFFTWPGHQRVGRINLDGTELTWLTDEDESAGYPDISPDGAWLAFVRPGDVEDEQQIVVRSLDDGSEPVVIDNATLPCFSPDGQLLAFAAARSYSGRIGVVDLSGDRSPRWLTPSGSWPTWLPSGQEIAYADKHTDGNQRAWATPVSGGEPRLLGEYVWNGGHYPFAVDPSGAIVSTDSRMGLSTLWLAEYD